MPCETKCSWPICKPPNRGHPHLTPTFLLFSEAKNQNATIRSRFPRERIAPIYRPVNVEFQIQQAPTASPRVGPAGGYHPSPSPRFPESFGALTKISLPDSITLMKEYGLEAAISDKKVPEEARLDNLNKLMSHFGVSFLTPALPTSAHLFLMRRSVTGCILDQRGKGQSSLVYGIADENYGPPTACLYFRLCCIDACITRLFH